jgi:nicotinamide-nucleotide amidase
VLPLLKTEYQGPTFERTTIHTAGVPESTIADRIQPVVDTMPPNMNIAYLPTLGTVKVRVGASGANAKSLVKTYVDRLTEVLQPDVYGYDGIELQEAIQHLMIEKGLTLATAESCTGGYLSHLLTSIPGSSAYYQGSIIAYANAVKTNLLNVPNEILKEYGAVSEKTARAMALGCIERLGVDIAIAITGVAGPDGGTEDKPVGMVWIAVGTKEKMKSHVFQLQKNRLLNIKFATTLSLIMLRKLLVNV